MATPATAVNTQHPFDPAYIEELKKQLGADTKAVKPKVKTSADEFGTGSDTGSTGPSVPVTMEYDNQGRIHIIIPANIAYSDTRDTASRNRRLVVARQVGDAVPGYLMHPNGTPIAVEFRLSSTLNLSVTPAKV